VSDQDPLGALLEQVARTLAEALAPQLAAALAARHHPSSDAQLGSRRLLSLDQLVERLPTAKKPETWKRWLYQRTRHGAIPGCHKIGGRLFFDVETTLEWLEKGCTQAELDRSAKQSLHVSTDV
jgi:hypothetical protein